MDTTSKLQEWAAQMGYKGTIPDDFSHVVNESTEHIWQQIIAQCKPKSQVQQARRNILLHRLRAKRDNNCAQLSAKALECPNSELETWVKKQALKEQVAKKKAKVDKVRVQLRKARDELNARSEETQNISRNIEESEKKEYLHRQKQSQFKNVIRSVKEQVQKVEQLIKMIDVDQMQGASTQEIDEVACSLKLNTDVDNIVRNPLINKLYRECYSVIDVVRSKEDALHADFKQYTDQWMTINMGFKEECAMMHEVNFGKLHGEHVKQAFMNVCLENQLDGLLEEVAQKEDEACNKLNDSYGNVDLKEMIKKELNRIEQETLISVYKQEIIEQNKPIFTSDNLKQTLMDLKKERREFVRVNQTLNKKIQSISAQWERFMMVESHCHGNFMECKKLLRWLICSPVKTLIKANFLGSDVFTKEMQTFEIFNLEYNKRLYYSTTESATDMFYRDTYDSLVCFDRIDDDLLRHLCAALYGPITSSSDMIRFFDAKHRRYEDLLEASSNMKCDLKGITSYNWQTLQHLKWENSQQLNRFTKFKNSPRMPSIKMLQQSMELWSEMPFANYVPDSVKHKEQCYKYYEDEFMRLFSQLD